MPDIQASDAFKNNAFNLLKAEHEKREQNPSEAFKNTCCSFHRLSLRDILCKCIFTVSKEGDRLEINNRLDLRARQVSGK
jgi:hypothetical protein